VTLIDDRTPAGEGTNDPAGHLRLSGPAQDLLFREAHTATAFGPEPVPDEQLRTVYELVKYAPTAFNAQPLRITLLRSPESRTRLVPHMADANQDRVATAPLVAVLSADRNFHDQLPRLVPQNPGLKDAFADPTARERFAASNAVLQAGYLIVGLRAAGLAVGPMTGFDASGIETEFFPDGDRTAVMVLVLGTPVDDGYRPRNPRLEFEEVAHTL
jgi:3-hydroxypropanoate dehydrogenase